jgi:hypothetical protein
MAKLHRSEVGVISAGKAWFNMTSDGGVYFVPGKSALYSDLFMFASEPGRHVVYRPGVTSEKALAVISKHDISNAVQSFKDGMRLVEGSMLQRLVTVYVRDPDARRQCIAKHGARCFVCNFSFKETSGRIADGFIHVHHARPLSDIGKDHPVDPIKDLRPVCPNCHAVLHMRDPAYGIEEVESFLRLSSARHQAHRFS